MNLKHKMYWKIRYHKHLNNFNNKDGVNKLLLQNENS